MSVVHTPSGRKMRLAVLASGRGSNFEAICRSVDEGRLQAEVVVVISDQKEAPVLSKAGIRGIKNLYINPADYESRDACDVAMAHICQEAGADLIVLAGYMRLLGKSFLRHFRWRTVNIHPALLPAFPGLRAQRQAVEYGVCFSGCTVHFVDEGMDTGPIILQAVVPVHFDDTEDTLTERILREEHRLYPQALQLIATGRVEVVGRKVRIRKQLETADTR